MKEMKTFFTDDNKIMYQYEILTNVYNGRLSAMQNILTIQSVFTSAALLVMFSDLNIIDIMIRKNGSSNSDTYAVFILSLISFIISLCSFISFIMQWNNCENIRKKLLEYENKLTLDKFNKKSGLKIPILLSAFILLTSTIIFSIILISFCFL